MEKIMKKLLEILLALMFTFLIVINVIILKKIFDFKNEIYDYINTIDYSVQRLYGKIESNDILFDNVLDAVELANKYTDNIAELSEYEYNYVLQQYGRDGRVPVETKGSFQSDRDLLLNLFKTSSVHPEQSRYFPCGVYYDYYLIDDISISVCWLEEEPDKLYSIETTNQVGNENMVFRIKRRFVHISENIYVMYILYEQTD